MSEPLNLYELQMIHGGMCIVWANDPADSNSGDSWISDEIPHWDPTWHDAMEYLPSREHMFQSCYSLLFPHLSHNVPDSGVRVPLKAWHMKRIKYFIDIMETDNGITHHGTTEFTDISEAIISIDEELETPEINDSELDEIYDRIHRLQPRTLFHDEPDTRGPRLKDCSRGLAIIEASMESGTPICEGQYLELADIFKRLSA